MRKCDLVMKGGITSGVVFPKAIAELARSYRFANIAGTSAGAIAASLAAAAEFGRRRGLPSFDALDQLPGFLGGTTPGHPRSNLIELFQPTRATAPLLELLLLAVDKRPVLGRIGRGFGLLATRLGWWPWLGLLPGIAVIVGSIAQAGPHAAWATLAAGIALTVSSVLIATVRSQTRDPAERWAGGASAVLLVYAVALFTPTLSSAIRAWFPAMTAGLVLLAAGGVLGAALAIRGRLSGPVTDSGFGICTGGTEPTVPDTPGLTEWLHGQIQTLAGRTTDDPPVTFADLAGDADPIGLRIMTTCLTYGRPYLLPAATEAFYFDPAEFRRLFPGSVVAHLEAAAATAAVDSSDRRQLQTRFMHPRLPLAIGDDLPILVATRMSLSFPLLLTAVPLWAYDWNDPVNSKASKQWQDWRKEHPEEWAQLEADPSLDLPADAPALRLRPDRVWFSDGGICSNFPVHLFDQPLPSWPTFAINLRYQNEEVAADQRVSLVQSHRDGVNPILRRLQGTRVGGGKGSLCGFMGLIADTMQNWGDNALLRVPGYRDRIAHINLHGPTEGGLNLAMTAAQIEALAGHGKEAARQLAERFTKTDAEGTELSWDNHRWTRLRSSLALFEQAVDELVEAYDATPEDGSRSYGDLVARGTKAAPTSYPWKQSRSQTKLAKETLDRLRDLTILWRAGKISLRDDEVPKPEPELVIRPKL